ncbi:Dolichyl pyrophosphate Man9GlcNAc2 alpha-1,3-glucosyltransferase [Neolecta irregularis DAH-3]|uniref:Alpha-1,3-glucosyltransferase n=1 Tax=Neolecta irregularis (strain DAH-3) TaxID=1198029 RepID=A0A1U7LV06_NEOID|nr:Dolichyl pyrophosphate Man9GlcNAc2 alpha-1,3-glucosyltransferase [Neolecta irregularis DAH-3]|eukprot:OLL26515.1 Dolichyl pyrophosphate Man9GlcNAc2 alpha-1,3-glucosyltransferase [Neolecta irregularis DAH-3]
MSTFTPRKRQKLYETNKNEDSNPPLVHFLALLKPAYIKWMTLPVILLTVHTQVLSEEKKEVKLIAGMGTPPDFGDFEAQRHWMEVTIHLPLKEWYHYDDDWWRLDYPPLTAYISWICGAIGNLINSKWFELDVSRGIESEALKVFMRATVVVCELVFYVPAVIGFVKRWTRVKGFDRGAQVFRMAYFYSRAGIFHHHYSASTSVDNC